MFEEYRNALVKWFKNFWGGVNTYKNNTTHHYIPFGFASGIKYTCGIK